MKTSIKNQMANFSNKEILDEAQKYECREEFKVKSHLYYLEAKRRSLVDVACRHMGHGYIAKANEVLA